MRDQYDLPRHVTIGGLDFYVDTWDGANDDKVTAGSGLEHIQPVIRAHGSETELSERKVKVEIIEPSFASICEFGRKIHEFDQRPGELRNWHPEFTNRRQEFR